jgi:outer membrane biosynthesis protein TonB
MSITRSALAVTDLVVDSSLSEKRKSLILTGLLFLAMLLLLFFLKFTSDQMGLEGGGGGGGEVAVNFGDSDMGSGDNYESRDLDLPASKPVPAETTNEEEIITDDTQNDVPAVATVKKPKDEPKKPETKPVDIPKPKPSKATNDALSNLMNGNSKGGDGDDKSGGNKGSSNGSTNATGYSGNGTGSGGGSGTGTGGGNGSGTGIGNGSGYGPGTGSGSGGGNGSGYNLGNRKALSKPKPDSKCSNETGVIVVEIIVDKNGKGVTATVIKGTTITASCLRDQAKQAALNTKWEASSDAPDKQRGSITYNFGLQ